jgi:hypothetical protein
MAQPPRCRRPRPASRHLGKTKQKADRTKNKWPGAIPAIFVLLRHATGSSWRKPGPIATGSRCYGKLITPSLRQTRSCGNGSRIGARSRSLVRDDTEEISRSEPDASQSLSPSSLRIGEPSPIESKPVSPYSFSFALVSAMSRLRMVSWPMRSAGVNAASSTFSMLSRSGA